MLVGKDWKIETDSLNVILYRRKVSDPNSHLTKVVGVERWVVSGYYSSVKSALHGMVEQGIRDADLVDLRVLDAKIDVLHQDVERLSGNLQQATGQVKGKKGIPVPAGAEKG